MKGEESLFEYFLSINNYFHFSRVVAVSKLPNLKITPEEKRYIKFSIKEGERCGLHLDESVREEIEVNHQF